jgi:hypothetical protein
LASQVAENKAGDITLANKALYERDFLAAMGGRLTCGTSASMPDEILPKLRADAPGSKQVEDVKAAKIVERM